VVLRRHDARVGHLFGHADGGQTDPASVTYPFLDGTSPNFDSVPSAGT